MMEIAAAIIFFGSIFGTIVIIHRKIPTLVSLPETLTLPGGENLFLRFGKKIKELPPIKNFSYELFLQKILAKIRILILKVEHLTFLWLQKLRESQKKKNALGIDEYWNKIRKEFKKLKK